MADFREAHRESDDLTESDAFEHVLRQRPDLAHQRPDQSANVHLRQQVERKRFREPELDYNAALQAVFAADPPLYAACQREDATLQAYEAAKRRIAGETPAPPVRDSLSELILQLAEPDMKRGMSQTAAVAKAFAESPGLEAAWNSHHRKKATGR